MNSVKKYIAEFIGTFVLVLLACGTACAVGCRADAGSGYLLTALAFGLVIVAMAYSIGNISGCHINPAVSLAMLISKKMTVKEFIFYVIAQFAGSIAGAGVLCYIFGADCGLGANSLYNNDIVASLIIEILLTFVFVLAILGVTSKVENTAVSGIVIGLALALAFVKALEPQDMYKQTLENLDKRTQRVQQRQAEERACQRNKRLGRKPRAKQ